MQKVIQALDALSLALTNHNHQWSPELRALYEEAVQQVADTPDYEALYNSAATKLNDANNRLSQINHLSRPQEK